jgi:hypothetical protein
MKDNEVNYLYNAFKNHAADDSVNTRSDEPCQSMNAKYDIAIAELDLEVTILTASLHKEQEKVVLILFVLVRLRNKSKIP